MQIRTFTPTTPKCHKPIYTHIYRIMNYRKLPCHIVKQAKSYIPIMNYTPE